MTSMRDRFTAVTTAALDADERVAVVLADIGADRFAAAAARHPRRVVNVGIREQLLVSVAGGMALEGMRPVVHTYAPFLVERAFEQIKLDLVHQGAGGAVLVSVGASYDDADAGRTHHAPGDVALLGTLPGVTIQVPGHADEAEMLLRRALGATGTHYVRLSEELNTVAHDGALTIVRPGAEASPLVIVVGPGLDDALEATRNLAVRVAYVTTVRPFPRAELAATGTDDVVLIEPFLAGTSSAEISAALAARPHRLLALGIAEPELRRYGTAAEHRRAHGLDAAGIRRAILAHQESKRAM